MKRLLILLFMVISVTVTPAFALTVNVNTANISQLTKIKGIGKVKAQAIIQLCQTDKPCKKAKDLLAVKGIGEKTLAKIKDSIVFK